VSTGIACTERDSGRKNESRGTCVPRRDSVDVEVQERDVDARVDGAVEEIVTADVAWVETGIIGRRKRAVQRRVAVERERAVFCTRHTHTSTLVQQLIVIFYRCSKSYTVALSLPTE